MAVIGWWAELHTALTGALITVTGGTPTLSATTDTFIQPGAALVSIAGGTPVQEGEIRPNTALIDVVGGAAGVVMGQVVYPSAAAVSATTGTPNVDATDHKFIDPTAAQITATGGTPSVEVATPIVLTPAAADVTATGGTPQVVLSMILVGTNTSSTTSVTIPAHQVGDLIVISAANTVAATVPTKPSASGTVPAFSDIDPGTAGNFTAIRTAQFVATATNHTSGTWTNASGMAVTVLRHQNASPIGGHAAQTQGFQSYSTAPAVTLGNSDGSSILIHFHAHNSSNFGWASAPTGYTRRSATSGGMCVNTKNDTTTDGAVNQSVSSGNNNNCGATVEILQ